MLRTVVFLSCLMLAAAALPEGRQSFLVIDDFQDAPPLVLALSTPAPPEVHVSGFQDAGDIIGEERDVQITAVDASSGSVFSVSATEDQLSFSAPPNSRSILLIQYDGIDDDVPQDGQGTLVLNPNGLEGADLTAGGLADAIFIEISTDLDTAMEFTVYTDATTTSTFVLDVLAEDGLTGIEIPFSRFVGDADFTSVGALETRLKAETSVDAVYAELFTTGPIPADPNGDRVYLMNPLACAPNWPAEIPVFETSSYSTSFTTTSSESDDDCDDGCDDDDDHDDDDDDDDSNRIFNPFGSSLASSELTTDTLPEFASVNSLSSDEVRQLFSSELSSEFSSFGNGGSSGNGGNGGGGEGSSSTSTSSASAIHATGMLVVVLLALV